MCSDLPYKLASRRFKPSDTLIEVGSELIGAKKILVIAGPCAVESKQQIIEIAHAVKEAGAKALRGGAYKPRTSPYSFQGSEEKGLAWLAEARSQTGLPIVTEIMDPALVSMVSEYADVLQIGSRSMHNFVLLKAVGKSSRPVLLKRGMCNTIEEFLMAAEYILVHGNPKVMLCERGIRTFETYTRNTFDINAIPILKTESHLPVLADPSHGVGKAEFVIPVARAAVAAGADGLIVEVHSHPDEALSDGKQSLSPEYFKKMIEQLKSVAEAVGRSL